MAGQKVHMLAHGRGVRLHRLVDGGDPVVFCHAAPGAGNFDPYPQESAAHGITLLAPDRPGYGASDPIQEEWATPGAAAETAYPMPISNWSPAWGTFSPFHSGDVGWTS